jgi:acyl-CoA thioester hydrolase
MKHIFEQKVYYGDTDAYGVVWHGAYLRWMEQGRVELLGDMGLDLVELKKQDIVLPVTNLSIRYKASAKLDETVVIETEPLKLTPITLSFLQTVKNKETGKVYIQAEVEGVAINNEGKLYRRMPEVLKEVFEKSIQVG